METAHFEIEQPIEKQSPAKSVPPRSQEKSSGGKRAFLKRGSSQKYDPLQASKNTKQYRYYADNFDGVKTPVADKSEEPIEFKKTVAAPEIIKTASKPQPDPHPTFDEVKRTSKQLETKSAEIKKRPASTMGFQAPKAKEPLKKNTSSSKLNIDELPLQTKARTKSYKNVFKKTPVASETDKSQDLKKKATQAAKKAPVIKPFDRRVDQDRSGDALAGERSSILEFERIEKECQNNLSQADHADQPETEISREIIVPASLCNRSEH